MTLNGILISLENTPPQYAELTLPIRTGSVIFCSANLIDHLKVAIWRFRLFSNATPFVAASSFNLKGKQASIILIQLPSLKRFPIYITLVYVTWPGPVQRANGGANVDHLMSSWLPVRKSIVIECFTLCTKPMLLSSKDGDPRHCCGAVVTRPQWTG